MTGATTPSPTATWAAGDYPAMARRLVPAGERVVAAVGAGPGVTLLDVGTGTGNAALAAARAGATSTGADPTPELLAVAAGRSRDQGQAVSWQQADAESITGVFDRVVSVFGVMYAPDAGAAAAAMLRCCAPGGRIASAAWTPDGFMAATNRAMGRYLPPPPDGAQPPTRWGEASFVRGLFADLGEPGIETTVERVRFTFASPGGAAAFWIRAAGHVQTERPRLVAEGRWEALHEDVAAVFTEWSSGPGPTVGVDAEYLLAVVTRSR